MKELKQNWYLSVTEKAYKMYPGIRLTDSQLSGIITKEFGGETAMHMANIRRSRCNDKIQPWVDAMFIDGVWVKNK